ncbi:hypothetical protein C5L14_11795 [Labrys okinawensis]|uniref:Uncharacterized protein n=1 Tax=Labrys okinawensis TaxID=346911 RepID=A0A2S9QD99_9HYPH|nr:hypothetical protein [Labrys okinawensis]PRH87305.1 hypothetical protein C5L14_11795 [Labrys okinawensis]
MEYVSLLFTLLGGLAGAIWDKPPRWVKYGIIFIILASSGFSGYKIWKDDQDKQAKQLFDTEVERRTIALSISDLNVVHPQILGWLQSKGYSAGTDCRTWGDGVLCDVQEVQGRDKWDLPLRRTDLTALYLYALKSKPLLSPEAFKYLDGLFTRGVNAVPLLQRNDLWDITAIVAANSLYESCGFGPNAMRVSDKLEYLLDYQRDAVFHTIALAQPDPSLWAMDEDPPKIFHRLITQYRQTIATQDNRCKS